LIILINQMETRNTESETQFAIGISNESETKRKRQKTVEEIKEMRMQQSFGNNLSESTKRSREEYAVKLRKERR